MRTILIVGVAGLVLTAGVAQATTVSDPIGDFLPTFVGAHAADLDVTSFGVSFDATASQFLLNATVAGPIDTSTTAPELYVIGVNTGTGVIRPFANIGEPNVIFNQAIVIRPATEAAGVGSKALAVTISGDEFSLAVPLADLPSTGFTPQNFGFNLWPRLGLGNNNQISDFAPQNATISAVPEASTWALMLGGFGAIGGAIRWRRRTPTTPRHAT